MSRSDGPPPPRRRGNHLRRRTPTWPATAFVLASLAALLAIPRWTAAHSDIPRETIINLAEPARALIDDLLIADAARQAAARAYYITGDAAFEARYHQAHATWDRARERLVPLLDRLDPVLTEELRHAVAEHDRARAMADAYMAGAVSRETYRQSIPTLQNDFDQATTRLDRLRESLGERIHQLSEQIVQFEHTGMVLTSLLTLATLVSVILVTWIAAAQRRLAERNARGHQERLALLDSVTEGVLGIDASGRCTLANAAAANMLGYNAEDFIGQDAHDLIHHHRADGRPFPRDECPHQRCIDTGSPTRIDDDVVWRRDGKPVPVASAASPIRFEGQIIGAVISLTDISQLKQRTAEREELLARERRQRREAEAAVAQRDDMLAIVSHDLRNPLMAIVTSVAGLQRLIAPGSRERRLVDAIDRSATRMTRLIQDLLDVSRLESGQELPLDRQPHDVRRLVKDALDGIEGQARAKHLSLGTDVPEGLLCVNGDRHRLLQILGNLLGNAVKFTPDGGQITVRARPEAGMVRVEVSDTGTGIAPESLPHIFDRYWQERRTQRAGAGLGLAITKGLVEAHGGHIEVTSRPGQGSTFAFTLPACQEAGSAPERPSGTG